MSATQQLLAAATLLVSVASGAQAQERFNLEGDDVAIYNLVGALHVTAASGNVTEVEVTRVGRNAGDLRIVTGRIGDANTLRVIYPGDDISYRAERGHSSETTLRVAEDGTFGDRRDGRRVRISTANRASEQAVEAAADLAVRLPAGARLLARVGIGEATLRNVNGTITVENSAGSIAADGVRGTLTLETASGSIRASGVEGGLSVNSASGGVELSDVRGPSVRVDVASGRIRARDVASEKVDLETASGSIDIENATTSDIRLHTASGSIDAELSGTIRTADLESASGSVRLRVPPNTNAELVAETASGSVNVDLPFRVEQQRRGYTRGTLGSGGGRLSISTASGSVTVTSN